MTMTDSLLNSKLTLVDVGNRKFSVDSLKQLLPDIETALFFAKAYKMTASQLGTMLREVFDTSVIQALTEGNHSTELQGYVCSLSIEDYGILDAMPRIKYDASVIPQGEILPQLWEMAELTLAKSIQQVADKLGSTVDAMPGKYGSMTFKYLKDFNAKSPTNIAYKAGIHHAKQAPNLVILDVSGSMTEETIATIVSDVVALAWKANAHLAIVSANAFWWEPGTFNVADVLRYAEFSSTQYEKLVPLFNQNWGTVVTVADYDSSFYAKETLARVNGRVEQVIDISLVGKPTYLAQCVGQLANEVKPLLVAAPGTKLIDW